MIRNSQEVLTYSISMINKQNRLFKRLVKYLSVYEIINLKGKYSFHDLTTVKNRTKYSRIYKMKLPYVHNIFIF